jgi:outer membrane receptor for ferric coprogen and ferric-rhodotorulic acid
MTLSNLSLRPAVQQGGYAVVNLSAGYRASPTVEVWGAIVNAGDKRYTDSSASSPPGIGLAAPRAFNVGLRGHW